MIKQFYLSKIMGIYHFKQIYIRQKDRELKIYNKTNFYSKFLSKRNTTLNHFLSAINFRKSLPNYF